MTSHLDNILNYLLNLPQNIVFRSSISKFARIGQNIIITPPFTFLNQQCVEIGSDFVCGKNLKLRAFTSFNNQDFDPKIYIGNNVHIETDCHIGCINRISIGDNVLIASRVFISDHSHGAIDPAELEIPPINRHLFSKGPIEIGKNVWIGEGVVVLPNVTIGDFSIIGANSVITRSIPPKCLAAGNPARIIRQLC